MTLSQALELGLKHQQAGHLADAERLYRSVLAADPNNAGALHLLGTLATQAGQPGKAVEFIGRAIAIGPPSPHYLNSLGNALKELGRLQEAEGSYRQALALNPEYAAGHYNLAGTLERLGRNAEAEESYRQALAVKPDLVEGHYNFGNLLLRLKRFAEAAERYQGVLALKPDHAEAHNNRGNALKELGRVDEAERGYRHALRLRPDYAYAHYNLGAMLHDSGRLKEAESCYRSALAANAGMAEAHYNLGNLLRTLGRPGEAEARYRRSIAIRPDHAEAHYNLGLALNALGRSAESERSYREALRLRPAYAEAHCLWLHQCQRLCDWSTLERGAAALRQGVAEGSRPRTFPFTFLCLPETSAAEQYHCARQFAQLEFGSFLSAPPLSAAVPVRRRKKLRLGYLSADFHDHATSYLLTEVLEQHDRSHFEVRGYSYGPDDGTSVARRVRSAFDVLVDLTEASDAAAAQRIFADEIDILVDLKGYTAQARVQICALRPAPVQVNWLGYPGTLGIPRLADYLIGDPIVTPLSHAAAYSERLALMPHCYQPNDRQRSIGATPTRAQAGLPASGFVFCCFNRSYKFTPAMLDLWCRLLREVPDSVLWLLQADAATQENILRQITQRGVPADRIVFAPKLALGEHLGRARLADLFLDTYPVTSHTTASDALWAGLPLVTLIGETFVSRVAASALHAGGLPELVAEDPASYFGLALDLATQPARLRTLRTRLAKNRLTCALFDSRRFTRDLESLYERMWSDRGAGRMEHIVLGARKDGLRPKRNRRRR